MQGSRLVLTLFPIISFGYGLLIVCVIWMMQYLEVSLVVGCCEILIAIYLKYWSNKLELSPELPAEVVQIDVKLWGVC